MKEANIPQKNFGRDEDLKAWNMFQYQLWLEFTKRSGIDTEDYKRLIVFGTFFHSCFSNNHEIPKVDETTAFLRNLNIESTITN